MYMKKLIVIMAVSTFLFACNDKGSGVKKFTVSGTITNNPAKMIFL